jgi:DmsE family decaheme c-type cytochrome
MRITRHMLTVCAVIGALAAATPLLAADAAPAAAAKGKLAADPNAKDLILKGDAKCTGCHDEADEPTGAATMLELNPGVLAIGKTKHGTTADKRTPTCTDCHGPSEKHVNHKGSDKPPKVDLSFRKDTKADASTRNDACLNCHRGGERTGWKTGAHAMQDVACTSCHDVHNRNDKVRVKAMQTEVCFTCHKEQRTQTNKASHHPLAEGKMFCSSCHNVHGNNPKHLAKRSTNETCYTCHMEKRGPFVHNHQPVAEDCGICHQPHGTTNPAMLKARIPFLCQDCHSHDSHPGQAAALPQNTVTPVAGAGANYGTNSTSALGSVGRGCLNCHTNIHGGNSTVNSATAGRFRR